MKKFDCAILSFVALVLTNFTVSAHDFYMEPSTGRSAVNEPVSLSVVQVDGVLSETFPYYPELSSRLFLQSDSGRVDIEPEIGGDPIATVRPAKAGFHIAGLQTQPRRVELAPEIFQIYVGDKGLDDIIAKNKTAPNAKIREIYTRYAKVVLAVGENPQNDLPQRPLGFEFELSPVGEFANWRPNKPLTFQLTLSSEPVQNTLIAIHYKNKWEEKVEARSDENGRITVTLPHAGLWVAHAVHIEPRPADETLDWESYWASLTFELPAK